MFSKKGLMILVVGLVVILMFGCAAEGNNLSNSSGETPKVVAVVNGVEISMEVFQDIVDRTVLSYQQQGFNFEGEEGEAVLGQIHQQIVHSLVQEEVLLQEVREKGYEVSEEVIEEEFEAIKREFATKEEFEMVLQINQLTEDELKNMLAVDMQIENFLADQVEEAVVTETEVRELYEAFIAQFEGIEEAQEVPTFEELKDEIEAEIRHGKQQQQVGQIVETLMEKSDIQVFI